MRDKLRGVMETAPGEPTSTSTIWAKLHGLVAQRLLPTDCLGQSCAVFEKEFGYDSTTAEGDGGHLL